MEFLLSFLRRHLVGKPVSAVFSGYSGAWSSHTNVNLKLWPEWQAQKGEGEGGGRKGNPPPLFPFLPIPYPLPLSTPATQATQTANLTARPRQRDVRGSQESPTGKP